MILFLDFDGVLHPRCLAARYGHRIPRGYAHHRLLRGYAGGLESDLVMGLVEEESGFRKYAMSSAKARGFIQVMPFWVDLIGTPEHNLFNLRTILRH